MRRRLPEVLGLLLVIILAGLFGLTVEWLRMDNWNRWITIPVIIILCILFSLACASIFSYIARRNNWSQSLSFANDWRDCIKTKEQTEAELEELEVQLAAKFGISGNIREQILQMDDSGELGNDLLESDWRATYHRYLYWYDDP